ncbi:MAG: SDR family oxidoreductase [Actinobacteria bacterium]|nr:SDR family oxidoreductase [Actinomycetota bacterium]
MDVRWNDGTRFAGRTAIVTGGSGALGGAIARSFAREGANVAISYRNGEEAARRVVEDIVASGGQGFAGRLDLGDASTVEPFVSAVIDRFGAPDVLVNTAGRIDAADAVRFDQIDADAWDRLFDVDVKGTMLMCAAVVPHMRARGRGAIVNFSGSYGNGVNQENLVNSVAVQYCAAKGAVRAFTASLARDLAPTIRVNAVSPGAIEANWEGDWGIPAEHVAEALSMTPLRRMGRPEEIAETVLFLASDGGGYITGQILQVDGGWMMTG